MLRRGVSKSPHPRRWRKLLGGLAPPAGGGARPHALGGSECTKVQVAVQYMVQYLAKSNSITMC